MIWLCFNERRKIDVASYLPIFRTNEVQNGADIKEKDRPKVTTQEIEGLSNGLMQEEIQDDVQSKIKQETTRLAVENMVRELNIPWEALPKMQDKEKRIIILQYGQGVFSVHWERRKIGE